MADGERSIIGIDIGGTSVKVVLVEREGESVRVVARGASKPYARPSVEELKRAISETLGAAGFVPSGAPAGVCLPGILSDDGGTVVRAANLPGIEGSRIGDLLPSPVGLRGVVSDAIAAARGYWLKDRRPGRLFALSLGTGVGAAVLDEGVPVRITHGGAGHFGQMDVGFHPLPDRAGAAWSDRPVGPDGGAGSLEAYIGAAALRERFGPDPIPGLLAAEASGSMPDPAFAALATALRIAHAVYGPDEIVLVGGLGAALAPKLSAMKRLVDVDLTSVAREDYRLSATDSPWLAAEGAAITASEHR